MNKVKQLVKIYSIVDEYEGSERTKLLDTVQELLEAELLAAREKKKKK